MSLLSFAERARIGRPTKYKAEFAEQVEKLCKLGLTDEELAAYFEIGTTPHRSFSLTAGWLVRARPQILFCDKEIIRMQIVVINCLPELGTTESAN